MGAFNEKDSENMNGKFEVTDGDVTDFKLLPKDPVMPPTPETTSDVDNDFEVKVGPLYFDYEQVKQKCLKGESRLRLIKDNADGLLLGFTVISPGESSSTVDMIWVNPQCRMMGLGQRLLEDAIQILPDGEISMSVRGGEKMTRLVTKLGFTQQLNGNLLNHYSLQKKT